MALAFGFIGAGNINRTHLNNAQKLGINLGGIADVALEAAEAARKQYHIARAYSDYRELLADNPDLKTTPKPAWPARADTAPTGNRGTATAATLTATTFDDRQFDLPEVMG